MTDLIPPMAESPPLPHVLVADDSRIVRATVCKHLRDHFVVREEANGEDAWAALLLDPDIRVVISDLSMPRLDGYGLLARIRGSEISRLREMPVIMISGDEDEDSRRRAKDLGADDFISKGIGTAELLARMGTLLKLVRTSEALEQSRADAATDGATGLMTRPLLLRQAEQSLAFALRHGGAVNALLVGFDAPDEEEAGALLVQFARMLATKVRKEDSLARWSVRELAVLSPGIGTAQIQIFAERLRLAVEKSAVVLGGRSIEATVSIGIARSPVDGETAETLLAAAQSRLAYAREAGGNRVMAGEEEPLPVGDTIEEALAAVAAGRAQAVKPHLGRIGQRLLPLLRLLDETYGLSRPIEELARRFRGDGS